MCREVFRAPGRAERLVHWERAPHARFCHPREEHLLPLHVCHDLAGRPTEPPIVATSLRKKAGMFHWQLAR
ncbi:MAG: extradiol ring-cleavage dioxygenase III subunit B [Halomonadaceae bacterium T82-2]|nr:MAG: extradiol ring-cleavage dioxygenase III subunit B [Halomonadaceae bacterium T82-2]